MSIRVGINGFGRMGRLALRVALNCPDYDIVHINEIAGGPRTAAHLLEFDSVHGRWRRDLQYTEEAIQVDGQEISFSESASPSEINWEAHAVDIVIEASGAFRGAHMVSVCSRVVVVRPPRPAGVSVASGATTTTTILHSRMAGWVAGMLLSLWRPSLPAWGRCRRGVGVCVRERESVCA